MLNNATVREWMSSLVLCIRADSPISLAHSMMKEHHIRRLAVVNEANRLVGIVTYGDVREAGPSDATTFSIWELTYLLGQMTVGKIMTCDVITIHSDESIINVAQLMLDHKVSGLPVVDKNGELIGIITESDIFRMVVRLGAEATA
jgi:CBS domain-containing protein